MSSICGRVDERSVGSGRQVALRWVASAAGLRYCLGMGTITVTELKKQPAREWGKSAASEDIVVTANGEPVALLLGIDSSSVESTRMLLRSVRALQAQEALQQAAFANGTSELGSDAIDAEIGAARRARQQK